MNIPNKISIFRIFLIPVFFLLLYLPIKNNIYFAAAVFLIAAATDALDGYIARKKNLITDLGKFLDPLADKILVVSALIYLVYVQIIPDWIVILIVAREFAVMGLRVSAASTGKSIPASKLGKFKTNSQILAVIFALFQWPFYYEIMLLAVLLTLVSGIEYIWKSRNLLKDN
ncbi:MAG: CDP-diacylglycerol--glycerol-3-phosphate 3-phosphatidyltransferase [Candidatus Undinarchaeales archaeon]